MTGARLVTLVTGDSTRIDIAIQAHPLDADDPMRPGDIMLWVDESDEEDPGAQQRIAEWLETALIALRSPDTK